jgi:hypothetical protein
MGYEDKCLKMKNFANKNGRKANEFGGFFTWRSTIEILGWVRMSTVELRRS